MNEITAFLSQAASPVAAGVQTLAGNTAGAGEGFAAILAQLQAFVGNANAANAPTQFQNVLGTINPTAAASASVLAAQADGTPATADTKALLDVLAALGVQPNEAAAPAPEAANTEPQSALVAQLLALRLALQNADAPPEAKNGAANTAAPVAPTTVDPGLRGTIPPTGTEANPTTQQPTPAETQAPALIPAATSETKPLAPQIQTKLNAPKRAANTQAPSATTTATSEVHPPTNGAKPANGEAVGATKAPSAHDKGGNAQTSSDKPSTAQAPSTPTPVANATPAPTTPSQVNTPQFEVQLATAQQAVPADALAVHIARKFTEGSSQFEISLHPAELGKVDVSLSVAHDGRIQAVLRAERPETLDMLQKDARVLEQQLRQAGLDVGSNALSFSLSNGGNGRQAPFQGWPAFADADSAKDTTGAVKEAAVAYLAVRGSGGVDIRI